MSESIIQENMRLRSALNECSHVLDYIRSSDNDDTKCTIKMYDLDSQEYIPGKTWKWAIYLKHWLDLNIDKKALGESE